MTSSEPVKLVLQRYLQEAREALVWKLAGLDERDARWPRTPTGTNLLGLVKHAASIEIGYFGDSFDRTWPRPESTPWLAPSPGTDDDPTIDLYAGPDESLDEIVDLYRSVWGFADGTISALPLDAPGRVPWWPEHVDQSLGRILVHVTAELQRHAGHADILRELHDGATGLRPQDPNLPAWETGEWAGHTARLREIANRFAGDRQETS